ncbi:MAG: WYL domain-containing protein [Muribaculaceae bacterium]|nr:WYL domain-containing protein [Muribaculaceae bacterium]
MAVQSTARCVWLVDTIRRYGRITRSQLQEAWLKSPHSDGRPLSRRTFCNHRAAAEELFNITIVCDPATFEYYIEDDDTNSGSVTDWLLNSFSLNNVIVGARDVTDRIFVENVPSAREHLGTVIDAIKGHHPVRFDYHPFTRSLPTTGVVIEPYFLKLFRQRWYLVGRNTAENRFKTYALDRIRGAVMISETFEDDPSFDIEGYFRDAFGIVVTKSEPKKIVLRVNPKQAKYFRALPLHHSQSETVSDAFSLFTYRMRVTEDFLAELLSYGPAVTVLEPPELRAMVRDSLQRSLDEYEN